jgi:hypothetical protein
LWMNLDFDKAKTTTENQFIFLHQHKTRQQVTEARKKCEFEKFTFSNTFDLEVFNAHNLNKSGIGYCNSRPKWCSG